MTIIVKADGNPYATKSVAKKQLTAKGLIKTHEVVEFGGGYGLIPTDPARHDITVNISNLGGLSAEDARMLNALFSSHSGKELGYIDFSGEERVALRPGDYVSTEGMTEEQYHAVAEAFMAAGAKEGEYPEWRFARNGYIHGFGWDLSGELYHHDFEKGRGYWAEHGDACRRLTIGQVLNATNANPSTSEAVECLDGSDDHTPSVIGTLHAAKRQLDEARDAEAVAEAVMQEAMDAVRAELGDGFVLSEAAQCTGLADHVHPGGSAGATTAPDPRDLPPEEWREGDVLEAAPGILRTDMHYGGEYEFLGFDEAGDALVKADDVGHANWAPPRFLRFRHRPK